MNRFSVTRALVVALLMVVASVASIGCQKKTADVAAKSAQPATRTPEESFATIVETFRRGVEDVDIGFDVQDRFGTRTMMTAKITVSHKLLPPKNTGEPYKAEIKVASATQYSLQQSTPAERPDADKSAPSNDSAADSSASAGSDVQIFDPAVASSPAASTDRRTTASKTDPGAVTVAEPHKRERIYELVYEKGRWSLVTELDPKTEESIKLAFDRALGSQS